MGIWSDIKGTTESLFRVGRASLNAAGLTAARTQSLPDKSGTIAMLDDIGAGSGRLPYTEITGTTQALAADNSYGANNAALVTCTLPAVAAIGSVIDLTGIGAGGWRVAQNTGQSIHFGNVNTTVGVAGQLSSTHRRDSVRMICVVANLEWNVVSSQGNIDYI